MFSLGGPSGSQRVRFPPGAMVDFFPHSRYPERHCSSSTAGLVNSGDPGKGSKQGGPSVKKAGVQVRW